MIDDLLATSLMDWLVKFPALFALAGALLGAIAVATVGWLIWRQFGPALVGASDKLVDLQKKQLDTLTSTLQMQKEHYDSELAETRRKAAEDVAEAKEEKDQYKNTLHASRETWNSEKLQYELKVKELESRPDLTTLFDFETGANERREKFYAQLSDVLGKQSEALGLISKELREHDSRVIERMNEIVQPVIQGMEKVVEAIKSGNGHAEKKKTRKRKARAEN